MGRMSKAIKEYQKKENNSRFIFKNYYEIIDMSGGNVEMVRNACQAAYMIGYNDAKNEHPGARILRRCGTGNGARNGNDAPG